MKKNIHILLLIISSIGIVNNVKASEEFDLGYTIEQTIYAAGGFMILGEAVTRFPLYAKQMYNGEILENESDFLKAIIGATMAAGTVAALNWYVQSRINFFKNRKDNKPNSNSKVLYATVFLVAGYLIRKALYEGEEIKSLFS